MGWHTATLMLLSDELLTAGERSRFQTLLSAPLDFDQIIEFDDTLPGPSIARLRHALYAIGDREVFRPLQYCDMGFGAGFSHGDIEWRTRGIVEMSSLHIESLIKWVGRLGRLPLGAALREPLVRRRVDAITYGRIQRFVRVYNAAKHDLSHPMGTHLFSVEDAITAYVVSRKLGMTLYPLAGLTTDLRLYNE